jgi:hypothetical protein
MVVQHAQPLGPSGFASVLSGSQDGFVFTAEATKSSEPDPSAAQQVGGSAIGSPERPQAATVTEVPAQPLSLQYSIGVRGSSLSNALPVVNANTTPSSSQDLAPSGATCGHHPRPDVGMAKTSFAPSAVDTSTTISFARESTPTEHCLNQGPEVMSGGATSPVPDTPKSRPIGQLAGRVAHKTHTQAARSTSQQERHLTDKCADITSHPLHDRVLAHGQTSGTMIFADSTCELVSPELSSALPKTSSAPPFGLSSPCQNSRDAQKDTGVAGTPPFMLKGAGSGSVTVQPTTGEACDAETPCPACPGIAANSRLPQVARGRVDKSTENVLASGGGVEREHVVTPMLGGAGGPEGTPFALLREDSEGILQPIPIVLTPLELPSVTKPAAEGNLQPSTMLATPHSIPSVTKSAAADADMSHECDSSKNKGLKAVDEMPDKSSDHVGQWGADSGHQGARDQCAAKHCGGDLDSSTQQPAVPVLHAEQPAAPAMAPATQTVLATGPERPFVPALGALQKEPFSIRWELPRTPLAPAAEASPADVAPAAAAAAGPPHLPRSTPARTSPVASLVTGPPEGFGLQLHFPQPPHGASQDVGAALKPEAALSPYVCARDPFAKANKLRYSDQSTPQPGPLLEADIDLLHEARQQAASPINIDLRPEARQQAASPTISWRPKPTSPAEAVTIQSPSVKASVTDKAANPSGLATNALDESSVQEQHQVTHGPWPVQHPSQLCEASPIQQLLTDDESSPDLQNAASVDQAKRPLSVAKNPEDSSLTTPIPTAAIDQNAALPSSLSVALSKAAARLGLPHRNSISPELANILTLGSRSPVGQHSTSQSTAHNSQSARSGDLTDVTSKQAPVPGLTAEAIPLEARPAELKAQPLTVPTAAPEKQCPALDSLDNTLAGQCSSPPNVSVAESGSKAPCLSVAVPSEPSAWPQVSPALTCIHVSSVPPVRLPMKRGSGHGGILSGHLNGMLNGSVRDSTRSLGPSDSGLSTTASAELMRSSTAGGAHDADRSGADACQEGARDLPSHPSSYSTGAVDAIVAAAALEASGQGPSRNSHQSLTTPFAPALARPGPARDVKATLLHPASPLQPANAVAANAGKVAAGAASSVDDPVRPSLQPIRTQPLRPCIPATSTSQETPPARVSSSGGQLSPYLITVRKTPTSPLLRAPVFPALIDSPSAPAAYSQVPSPNNSAALDRILSMPLPLQVCPLVVDLERHHSGRGRAVLNRSVYAVHHFELCSRLRIDCTLEGELLESKARACQV